MALRKCPDCDRDVSSLAVSCPNCGRPTPTVATAPPLPVIAKRSDFAIGEWIRSPRRPAKPTSVASGVFSGLFHFFVTLPITIFVVVFLMIPTLVNMCKN